MFDRVSKSTGNTVSVHDSNRLRGCALFIGHCADTNHRNRTIGKNDLLEETEQDMNM